jgi:hypothetical protein
MESAAHRTAEGRPYLNGYEIASYLVLTEGRRYGGYCNLTMKFSNSLRLFNFSSSCPLHSGARQIH